MLKDPRQSNGRTHGRIRVLIYGGGAVGLGIASCLLHAGHEVDILARPETVAALETDGLVRTGIFGDIHVKPGVFRCYCSLQEACSGPYDFILICIKSFDSHSAVQNLGGQRACMDSSAKLVLFQNGWGNAEIFAGRFDKGRVYSARVITGFHRHRPNEVEITVHADSIHIGSLFGADASAVESLCRAISKGGIPCEMTDVIEKDLWAKMLYNCALNPLGAILGVPYGALAEHAATRQLMEGIVEEVFEVMAASGYGTHWPQARDFLAVFYERLVPDTAEHESSMLQDLTAGKRTEIDALNGAVIRLADEHGLKVPYNSAVYRLIKFLESSSSE
jgi:2-dehydropantoate 2-reductase